MSRHNRIGFMQGRLLPLMDGRIQAFPWSSWQEEFHIAEQFGFRLMEWTLDQDRLYENPLLTIAGRSEIKELCRIHGVSIPSVTGDCFMQAPFWKVSGNESESLQRDFLSVAEASAIIGISVIVIPLVDNGRIENITQEDALVSFLKNHAQFFAQHNLLVAFESDFDPLELVRFIGRLDPTLFGINYDIGNSAALGYRPAEEIAAYGDRIINIHVKDRVLGGPTVPLGLGNADFETIFAELARVGYTGNFILQTARAVNEEHAEVLCRYRDMTIDWLTGHAA